VGTIVRRRATAQVVAKNIRDLHRITGSILAVDGVVRSSTAISRDEVIPCWPHAPLRSGSPRAPGADPNDPSPALCL
jgi:hypothetical protein